MDIFDYETIKVLLLGANIFVGYRIAKYLRLCLGELSATRYENGCRAGLRPRQPQEGVDRISH